MRYALVLLCLAGCQTAAPERDVFLPPYAEKGCWARLYAQAAFAGAARELEGPIFQEAMDAWPRVRSLMLGPHARLTGYAEPLFRERTLSLAPGTAVRDTAALEFDRTVRSFRLECQA